MPLMATSGVLLHHLHRSRPLSSLSTLYTVCLSHLLPNPNRNPNVSTDTLPSPLLIPSHDSQRPHFVTSVYAFHYLSSRSFSTRSNDESEFLAAYSASSKSEDINFDLDDVIEDAANGGSGSVVGAGGESILPVRVVISLLDSCHDLTGLPWWIIIASSTVAMRITLFPLLVLQLKKLVKISQLFPKLPPPFPPPLSGRSFINQFSLFRKERLAIGCPSYLWFLAYFSIQVPCFLLWMTSIRRMSLDNHPGFDCGGILWFQNLTVCPHGVLGSTFPFLIAGLHYINIQLSFRKSSVQKDDGLLSLLAKYYKIYLDLLTLPLFFIGFCIPQGSLVYWVTNSSLTIIQQLSLKHPAIRAKLGLPEKDSPKAAANSKEMGIPESSCLEDANSEEMGISKSASLESPTWRKIPVENLSPKELVALSVQLLSNRQKETPISLLQLALEKDPNYEGALIVMGQTLLQQGLNAEAAEYLERAISKICLGGHLTEAQAIDHLIIASQWAGVAYIRQGKNEDGIVHLERIPTFKEPDDPKSRAHYFDGLVLLASALYNEGRKAEAAKYLRLAVAYDPAHKALLEQCENDEDNFVSHLVSSRRGDY